MANENETVADIKSEMYGIVADEFGYVKLAQSDFIGIADRSYAAHKREVAELQKLLKEAADCADEFQKFFETHPYLCKYTRDIVKKSRKAVEGAK